MSTVSVAEKMIILAVDDDTNNLKTLVRLFQDYDEYTLHCCESGQEALENIEQLHPDLMLLDIQMPVMDGYEVCRQIKTDPKTQNIMVLLLSGMANLVDRLQGYEVDADDYLTKPFDEQELFAKVRILLRLKEAQDKLRQINSELSTLVDSKTREVVRKERQALVGQMVLGIIHNLRGPLTSAKGMADLASFKLGKILTDVDEKSPYWSELKKINHHLDMSKEANDALADMIGTILNKGRFDAQKALLKVDLNKLIAEEIEFFNADLFFKNNVKKVLSFDENLPPIKAVPADFSQLCYNLMRNAVDAMHDKDERVLTVTTTSDNASIEIRFQDTGDGIDPDRQKLIFDPFFTTKPSAEEAKEGEPVGTGLGLYTCLELVKLYNGKIRVESPEGCGCTFIVTIPVSNSSS